MKITVLGSGGASGVPSIEWGWGLCDPENPKNRRMRPSMLVEEQNSRVLIDTSPDLHWQLLGNDIRALDAVLFTHAHADHVHGIDDLRAVNRAMRKPIPIWADDVTLGDLKSRFGYCLGDLPEGVTNFFRPVLIPHRTGPGETIELGKFRISVFDQDHGYCRTLTYRFGPIAYSTDVVEMPDETLDGLRGVDVWVVSALMRDPHPTHAHLDKVLGWVERVKPRRTILSHLSGVFDYETLKSELPDGVEPAYDGLTVEAI
ncbi:MAG: MBL fold metallo-hydrolase [Magnetovibrionaceae bacterium]